MQKILSLLAATLLATPALAQPAAPPIPPMSMPGLSMPPTQPAAQNPSTQAYKRADEKMMTAMDRAMSGNPDQDFVAGMLPHHTGAVDMAKIELKYGKDPELRRLARTIIAAQAKEIAQMQAWQRHHPAQP